MFPLQYLGEAVFLFPVFAWCVVVSSLMAFMMLQVQMNSRLALIESNLSGVPVSELPWV